MFLWCLQVRLLFFGNLRAKAMPQYRNLPTSWRRFSPIKMEAERLSHKRHLLLKIFPQRHKDYQESLSIPVVSL